MKRTEKKEARLLNRSTDIRFEEGLDYSFVRSTYPAVVNDIYGLSRQDRNVVIDEIDLQSGQIAARVPLAAIEAGKLFGHHKDIRQMAYAGGSGSVYIAH